MIWERRLQTMKNIYVDSVVFIYLLENSSIFSASAIALFRQFEENPYTVYTSVVTLTEILVKPIAAQNDVLQSSYTHLLETSGFVTLVSVSREVAVLAARLRATYTLRTPDALHIATALTMGCQAFITNDNALKRVSDISVLTLDENSA